MTAPRVPMLQRKPGAGVGGPPVPGASPKMPPLPLPSAGAEGDPNVQAALMAAAADAAPGGSAGAPDVPSGVGMTECPNCGCAFDPRNPVATATPPAGAAAPGGPPGGGMPPDVAAKLGAIMGAGGGGGGA